MPLSKNYVNQLMRNYEDAVRLHEMRGAYMPEDWDKIEEGYQRERKRIKAYLLTAQNRK